MRRFQYRQQRGLRLFSRQPEDGAALVIGAHPQILGYLTRVIGWIEARLEKLKGLLDKGLISPADYDGAKAELLKKLIG